MRNPPVRSTRLVRLFGAGLALALLAAASPRTIRPRATPVDPGAFAWLVPAAAHAPGVGGELWTTDLAIVNPGGSAATARLFLLAAGRSNLDAVAVEVPIAARAQVELRDVINATFHADGAAAILVGCDAPLVVTSRTSTSGAAGGFGQQVSATRLDRLLVPGKVGFLSGLADDLHRRTNVGLVNVSSVEVTVELRLIAADGSPIPRGAVKIPAMGMSLLPGVLRQAAGDEVPLGRIEVRLTTQGRVAAWASVVDDATSDPAWVRAEIR